MSDKNFTPRFNDHRPAIRVVITRFQKKLDSWLSDGKKPTTTKLNKGRAEFEQSLKVNGCDYDGEVSRIVSAVWVTEVPDWEDALDNSIMEGMRLSKEGHRLSSIG